MIRARLEGFESTMAALRAKPGQYQYAMALAIHRTAHIARRAGVDEMRNQFDKPTPIVLNSLFVSPSRPDKKTLSAMVLVKDIAFGSTIRDYSPSVPEPWSMAAKIGHQFSGGARMRKGLESGLTRRGYISATEFVAPGPDAPLNQYGNLTSGFVQQVLSALQAQRDPSSNATQSKRSRRNARKAMNIFWAAGDTKAGGLRRGLWARSADGSPLLLLVVLPKVNYKRRIDLHKIVDAVVDREFNGQFLKAIDYANATAR